jgi:hypothetical protein
VLAFEMRVAGVHPDWVRWFLRPDQHAWGYRDAKYIIMLTAGGHQLYREAPRSGAGPVHKFLEQYPHD